MSDWLTSWVRSDPPTGVKKKGPAARSAGDLRKRLLEGMRATAMPAPADNTRAPRRAPAPRTADTITADRTTAAQRAGRRTAGIPHQGDPSTFQQFLDGEGAFAFDRPAGFLAAMFPATAAMQGGAAARKAQIEEGAASLPFGAAILGTALDAFDGGLPVGKGVSAGARGARGATKAVPESSAPTRSLLDLQRASDEALAAYRAGVAQVGAEPTRRRSELRNAIVAPSPLDAPPRREIPTDSDRYAILTPENPGGRSMDAAANAQRRASFERELRERGFEFDPVRGRYQDGTTGEVLDENSYMVRGLPEREAKLLARRYGQNGVITQAGYHDLVNGTTAPSRGVAAAIDPAYTELPDGQRFSLDIDWENSQQSPVNALPVRKGANPEVMRVADEYLAETGIEGRRLPMVQQVDRDRAAAMARVYEELKDAPDSPEVRAAYAQMVQEVEQQFDALQRAGYSVEFMDSDPYKNSTEMMADLAQNRRLRVLKTNDGSDHPLLTREQNDKFRAVHDFFGHSQSGYQFGPKGEEGAFRDHSAMFSPEARRAMATETRGQNSWVNFGPNSHLPVTERPFAQQKSALWPEEFLGDYAEMPTPAPAAAGASAPRVSVATPQPAPAAAPSNAPALPPQVDLPRFIPPRVDPQRIEDVEDMAFRTYTGKDFTRWLRDGNFADWYNTVRTQQKAIDALGDEAGPEAFRRMMDVIASVTARSDPANNLRRGSYYFGLDRAALLDDEALKAQRYKQVPVGMGHMANNAHQAGLFRLLTEGGVNSITNPKPAGFTANLQRNFRPFTNDTRMATAAAMANPRLIDIGGLVVSRGKDGSETISPRDWAYAPMERAAQRAARRLAKRGLLEIPDGADPTAWMQAKVWDGVGEEIPGASRSMGTFDDVFDTKLSANARAWGVSPAEANRLVWLGNPLDLPLGTDVIPKGLLDFMGGGR